MEAGIELDKLVAEKVMGWKIARFDSIGIIEAYDEDENAININRGGFNPSTDISDAWKVVDKFNLSEYQSFALFKAHEKYDFEKDEWNTPGYEVHINCECINYDDCPDAVWAETAPLAICLAALKSVGETK